MTGLRGMLFNLMSEKIAKNLRQDVYESAVNKDIEFFDANKVGDLCNHFLKLIFFSE